MSRFSKKKKHVIYTQVLYLYYNIIEISLFTNIESASSYIIAIVAIVAALVWKTHWSIEN